MAYKTVTTILSAGSAPLRGLNVAALAAASRDAHLEVLCLGIDPGPHNYSFAEVSPMLLQSALAAAQDTARSIAEAAQEDLAQLDINRYSVTPIVSQPGLLPGAVRRHVRFSDLVVMSSPYAADAGSDAVPVVEAALFQAGVPVLVVPDGMTTWDAPRRMSVAWNESDEAMAATVRALPFLSASDTAYITVVDPPQHGPDRSDPGGLLAQFLSRHGVRCEVDVLSQSLPRVSEVLIRAITDRDIDMVVMGAYGRARWSEAMFGGATRDMLEHCPVPLFLAR